MTRSTENSLGDWLKRPITWIVLLVATVAFVLMQVIAPGILGGSNNEIRPGESLQVNRAPGVEVLEGSEVSVIYVAENREDEAMEISFAEITYLRVEGGGPECAGASRAGVQAKLENHLVGTRIPSRTDFEFEVIFTGRHAPVPDCVGATVQADVDLRVVPYE